MAKLQAYSKRKSTGGKYHHLKGKRKAQLGSELLEVTIGDKKTKNVRGQGGNLKARALLLKEANVLDPKTKKYQKAEIKTVKENPANPHFVRRNTITKGAIIETSAGSAKVTSRPGQTGTINAILVSADATPKTPEPKIQKAPEAPKPEAVEAEAEPIAEAQAD
jgi:small subunit ribosomal protein S8e